MASPTAHTAPRSASPVGVSGAVFLLPVQLNVLHVPNPSVTPTNLMFNVIAGPGALFRYRRAGQLTGPAFGSMTAGAVRVAVPVFFSTSDQTTLSPRSDRPSPLMSLTAADLVSCSAEVETTAVDVDDGAMGSDVRALRCDPSRKAIDDPVREQRASRLREQSPGAARLLELCAYFSPDPISLTLLYSDEMIDSLLPFDTRLKERSVLAVLIRDLTRFSLAKIDRGSNTIEVHRLVQAVVRAQMPTPEYREEVMHEVHRILVGARPRQGGTDDPENWPRYDLIRPHLSGSEADVRQAAEAAEDALRDLG